MGMDGIDLCFRLERRFQIEIDSEEVVYLYLTPARVEWLVLEKLAGRQPAIVDVPALAGWIMDALKEVPNRSTGWMSTRDFERAFPPTRRGELWQAFGDQLGVDLPALELPDSECPKIPRYVSDYRNLAIWFLDHHPERCPIEREGTPIGRLGTGLWQDQEVSAAVIEELCDALGVEPIEVTPDSLMADELGME